MSCLVAESYDPFVTRRRVFFIFFHFGVANVSTHGDYE